MNTLYTSVYKAKPHMSPASGHGVSGAFGNGRSPGTVDCRIWGLGFRAQDLGFRVFRSRYNI